MNPMQSPNTGPGKILAGAVELRPNAPVFYRSGICRRMRAQVPDENGKLKWRQVWKVGGMPWQLTKKQAIAEVPLLELEAHRKPKDYEIKFGHGCTIFAYVHVPQDRKLRPRRVKLDGHIYIVPQ